MKRLVLIANALLLVGIAAVAYHIGTRQAIGRFELPPDTDREFQRGDANDDGQLDISDPVAVLGYLFLGLDEPPCLAAADSDDSGSLDVTDAIYALAYLFSGGPPPEAPFPERGEDPTPDLPCRELDLPPLPEPGSLAGPDRALTQAEAISWRRGRKLFDRPTKVVEGLGPLFNGDSCRGCHFDPVIGGSGGIDVDVVRYAHIDEGGIVTDLPGGPAASRLSNHGRARDEHDPAANVIETRQTPSIFGLGLVDRLPEDVLLANADPDDLDGDGISGRARIVDGRIGRFGHKCGVPSLFDFTADAAGNELGLTVDPELTPFAVPSDDDDQADPELSSSDLDDLAFFTSHIAPPVRRLPNNAGDLLRVRDGEALFRAVGCVDCHVPALEGPDGPVEAYSDFLLHEVANPASNNVAESGVRPGEFRTAPLWGLRDSGPYLHDGSAESIRAAIIQGHHWEATASRQLFEGLSFDEQNKIEEFLESL